MIQNTPLMKGNMVAILYKPLLVSLYYSSMLLPDEEDKYLA